MQGTTPAYVVRTATAAATSAITASSITAKSATSSAAAPHCEKKAWCWDVGFGGYAGILDLPRGWGVLGMGFGVD